MIWTPLQELPTNVGDLGKSIVAKGFEKLPKVQKIARSGHTGAKEHSKETFESRKGFSAKFRLKWSKMSRGT